MVHFVGAGPGAEDLITLRGARLLQEADVIIYAGSLVSPALLSGRKPGADVYDSAVMTLEQVVSVMKDAEKQGKTEDARQYFTAAHNAPLTGLNTVTRSQVDEKYQEYLNK